MRRLRPLPKMPAGLTSSSSGAFLRDTQRPHFPFSKGCCFPLTPCCPPWRRSAILFASAVHRLFVLLASFVLLLLGQHTACAIEAVRVPPDAQAIDLTQVIEHYDSQTDAIQVATAPGADGIVRRIEVTAKQAGSRAGWIALALTNDTSEQLERLIIAPHYRLVGSGVIWPDLGSSRIRAITPSQGVALESEDTADADIFRLTLDPGATVTYVAELSAAGLPQLYLWEPDAWRDKLASLTLYKGIVIGISGLLALFLSIVFLVRGSAIFIAAALLAWSVLVYVCIDFDFQTIAFL